MIIHSDRRPSGKHMLPYNGSQSVKIAAIVLSAEDVNVGHQDLVMRRRGQLTQTGSEQFKTILVIHSLYDPLTYALFLSYRTDERHSRLTLSSMSSKRQRAPKLTPSILYAYQLF